MAISTLKAKLQAAKNKNSTQNLSTWNKWLAVFYAAQGAAIVLFSKERLASIDTGYQAQNMLASDATGGTVFTTATHHLGDLNMTYLVAAFLLLAAVVHGLLAFTLRKRYDAELAENRNSTRWIGYAAGNSLVLVAIALLCGVSDLSLLVALAGFVIGTNLIGLVMERRGKTDKIQWLLYGIGAVLGMLPWVVVGLYLWGAGMFSGSVPGYVYGVFASAFVLSGAVAGNVYLLLKQRGSWKQYMHGERTYIALSVLTYTTIAWQIFAGLLRP